MSTTVESSSSSGGSSGADVKHEEEEGSSNDLILDEITRAYGSWLQRITLLENELRRNKNVQEHVIESLQRQLWDGLITSDEASELRTVIDLWTRLHASYSCKQLGAEYSDREIVEILLDLLTLDQISKSFVARIVLELCRPRYC